MLALRLCFLIRNEIISWETAEGKENVYYHPDLLVSVLGNTKKLKSSHKTHTTHKRFPLNRLIVNAWLAVWLAHSAESNKVTPISTLVALDN